MAGMAEELVRRPATPSGPGTVHGRASDIRHQPRPVGPKGIAPTSHDSEFGPGAWRNLGLPQGQHISYCFSQNPFQALLDTFFPKASSQLPSQPGSPTPGPREEGSGGPDVVPTCVFQQCLGCIGPVDDLHQVVEDHLHIGLHFCPWEIGQ